MALALLLGLVLNWWMGDARRIGRRLALLESLLEKDGPESDLVSLARSRQVAAIFVPGALVTAVPYEGQISSQRELIGGVHRFRTSSPKIDVTLASEELDIQDNGTAWMALRATVAMDLDNRRGRESYRVRCQWIEISGEWKIKELEVLEILPQGPGLGWLP